MGFLFITQTRVYSGNETEQYKGNLNTFNIRKKQEYEDTKDLTGNIISGILEFGLSIFTFGSSAVASAGLRAASIFKNTSGFLAKTASTIAKTTTTAAISGTVGLTKDFVSGKSAEEAFSRYGTLVGSAAGTGFVGGLTKGSFSKLLTKSLKLDLLKTDIFEKQFVKTLSFKEQGFYKFIKTNKSVSKILSRFSNSKSKFLSVNSQLIKKYSDLNLNNILTKYKKFVITQGDKIGVSLSQSDDFLREQILKLKQSSILDDLLSGGLLKNLNSKISKLFQKFLNKNITESVLYKKSLELLNRFDKELSESFSFLEFLEQGELESFKDFQNKFSVQNMLENYNKYFQRNYQELQDRLKTDLSSVEVLKLEQDMNNYVLESNGASPFKNDGEGVIDINKTGEEQSGKFGSQWILGWKWYPKLDEKGEVVVEGEGNLRVFFKSRVPRRATKILKKGKNKGKKVFAKPMKGTILFLDVPYLKMKEFTENSNVGSYYWYNFAKRPIKGGGKTEGWEPRRYADIDFLNKINQGKRENLIKQWGLSKTGLTLPLTRKLGYLATNNINFKYFNTKNIIKTAFKSPASVIKQTLSKSLSLN